MSAGHLSFLKAVRCPRGITKDQSFKEADHTPKLEILNGAENRTSIEKTLSRFQNFAGRCRVGNKLTANTQRGRRFLPAITERGGEVECW